MATYYCIKLAPGEELYRFNPFRDCVERTYRIFENTEHWSGRSYHSQGIVYIMELIPESRMNSVKYLKAHKGVFIPMTLSKDDVIKYENRYYLKSFEQGSNTDVWQNWAYLHPQKDQ